MDFNTVTLILIEYVPIDVTKLEHLDVFLAKYS